MDDAGRIDIPCEALLDALDSTRAAFEHKILN